MELDQSKRREFIALRGSRRMAIRGARAAANAAVAGSLSGSSLTEGAPLLVTFRKGLKQSGSFRRPECDAIARMM